MSRPLINLIATLGLLFFFESKAWIKVPGAGAAGPNDAAHIFDVVLVGILMFEIGEILEVCFSGLLALSGGWFIAMLPVYVIGGGYIRLEAAARLLPDWFTYDHEGWCLFAMSATLGATRWHLSRGKKRSLVEDNAEVQDVKS